ncbi:MAG: ArnT family glycosyltransferase [bacterium]
MDRNSYFNNLNQYEKLALLFSGLMLFGLLFLGHFHKMGTYGTETDFYWAYAPDAQNILAGKAPEEPGVGPGYALVLAGLNLIIRDWFLTGKVISILSAVLCGFFTFKLVQHLFDVKVAFFTMVLWHVTVLPFAILAGTDMFFACLLTSALYSLFREPNITNRNLIVSAALMGYAYLTRHNAITFPICVALILLFLNPDSLNWTQRFVKAGIFAAVFVTVLLPWTLVLQFTSGSAARSDSYLIIASHFYGRPGVVSSEDMRLAAHQFNSLFSVVFYDFTYFVKHYLKNLYRHFYDILIHSLKFPAFLFVGAGAFTMLPSLTKRQLSFFVFPVFAFLLLCLVHYEPRYYLYILSFLILLIAFFLFPKDSGHDKNAGLVLKYGRPFAYGVTVLFMLIFSLKEITKHISGEPRELLQISRQLRENVHVIENELIIARKPHLGFLSNLKTTYFPEAKTVAELLKYAKKERADYLLYGEVELQRRPELSILLYPEKLPGEFEPILVWKQPRTIVYKLRI